MKNLFLGWCFLFCNDMMQAQGFALLGQPSVVDVGNRMIATSDGGFVTAGSAGDAGVLYKTDCLGNLVAQLEKSFSAGKTQFFDVLELPSGEIVAAGTAFIEVMGDTSQYTFVLKTSAGLVETVSRRFDINNLPSQAKSIARAANGDLLIWGEVASGNIDFLNAYFQRIEPQLLSPVGDPVLFDEGIDLASRITPTNDGHYILSGSNLAGNIFDPEAYVQNTLRAYKVDESGNIVWKTSITDLYQAKYSVSLSCGAVQSPASGNIVLGGTTYGGSDEKHQDAFFALINLTDGSILDTAFVSVPSVQRTNAIVASHDVAGLFSMVGENYSSLGETSLMAGQVYETASQLISLPPLLDPSNPASFRDMVEIDPGRFAFMGHLPESPTTPVVTNIFILTPGVQVSVVYQNCALAASLNMVATAFQWLHEGQPIPGATQGAYFPTEPGLYQVQVLDTKGCYGVSDTFRVEQPLANFNYTANGLTATFENTSVGAVSQTWYFGDGNILTQQNPEHSYATTGVYTVTLIIADDCGIKDTLVQQVGVTPANEPGGLQYFNLAPNPTNGVFRVDLGGQAQEELEFVLVNTVGQTLLNESVRFQNGLLQKDFDLRALPDGPYFLRIRSGRESKTLRVLKTGG